MEDTSQSGGRHSTLGLPNGPRGRLISGLEGLAEWGDPLRNSKLMTVGI